MSNDLLDALVSKTNGQSQWTVTGPDAGECTAIPHEWEQMLGLGIVYGNACDTYDNAPDSLYLKELNGPSNFPLPGAIVVWGAGALGSSVGHTAVALSGSDSNTLRVLEQNNPMGTGVRIHSTDYTGVRGWFYPRKLQAATANTTDVPNRDDEGVVNGQGLRAHSEPNTTSSYPWYYDDNEHITLLQRTHGENVTTGPYAPSDWWYRTDKGWVSDAFIRTTQNPANVPDYVPPTTSAPAAPAPTPRPTTGSFGVDISSYQGDIDFNTLKPNIDFVVIRAGHVGESFGGGADDTDTKFVHNRDAARQAGIPCAFYWYCYPSLDPQEEAQHFIDSVGELRTGESLWADIEEDDPNLVAWARAFKEAVEALAHRECRGYLNLDFYNRYSDLKTVFPQIWAAHYGEPAEQRPFAEAIMHQYTSAGHIQGIEGDVDLNIFFGTMSEFQALGAAVEVPVTPATPEPTPASTPEPTPAPISPIVEHAGGNMIEDIKKAVVSRKFWIAVGGIIAALANNDVNGAILVVMGYLGIQGAIDHKNAG